MSLARKIFRGSALNAADLIVRMAVMFLMTPFMVSRLGMEGYGIWVVLTTAVSFLDLLDGGITLSGTRFLARTIGSKDERAYADTAGTLSWLYRRIGMLCLAGTAVLALTAGVFVKDSDRLWEARQVLVVLGASLALRFFLRIHLVVLKSHVRYDLIVVSGLVKLAVQSGLIVAILLRGQGLLMLAVAQIASDVLDQLLVVLFSRRTASSRISAKLAGRKLVMEVLGYSATTFLNTLGQYLRSKIDPLVLTLTTGVATVPVYNMGMRLLSLFFDLMNAVLGGPLLAGFCQVDGKSGIEVLRGKFLQAMRFSVPFVALGCFGLFAYGPAFLDRWLGPVFADSGAVLRLLVVPYGLWLMQLPATNLLLALHQHQTLMKATFVAGLCNLVLSLALASRIGFFGVVISTMIDMSLFYGVLVPWLAARASGVPLLFYYWNGIARPLLVIGIPLTIYSLAGQFWVEPDYLRLGALAAGMAVFAAVAFWRLILHPDEREALGNSRRRKRS